MSVLFKTMSVSRFVMAAALAAGVLTVGAARTEAATLGFSCITNNSASSCAIGQSQLSAELTDLGGGQVEFMFTNTGQANSSVTQIYFDQPNPMLMSANSSQMSSSNGVAFTALASNRDLPGGQGLSFQATNGYGSRPPVSLNGINPNEWLKLVFTLNSGSTFASLLTNLATGDLRIGMHVQSLGQWGNSESFVNRGAATVVPEPASLILLGTGLAGAVAARRRRKQQAARS